MSNAFSGYRMLLHILKKLEVKLYPERYIQLIINEIEARPYLDGDQDGTYTSYDILSAYLVGEITYYVGEEDYDAEKLDIEQVCDLLLDWHVSGGKIGKLKELANVYWSDEHSGYIFSILRDGKPQYLVKPT